MSIDSGQDAEIQKEARMLEIQAERAGFLKPDQSREVFLKAYLENIVNVLPVQPGHERIDRIGMNKRIGVEFQNLTDIKIGETPYGKKGFNSNLMLNQTFREFFTTIDRVLEEVGVDLQEIGKLQHDFITGDASTSGRSEDRMLGLAEPAYIKLREMGYERNDFVH